ncbi:exonuclease V subunit beta [Escherichia coli]|uniref:Exonuclease V subunit beta n=1 Tax=Escherichia coli TaxID=562 RepID=A0A2X1NA17_ECOLX|nr:exonuclease V subunit beta [Escherichia coli]
MIFAWQTAQTGDNQPWQVNDVSTAELNAKTLQRLPGDNWRVTSYSGLQQRGHGIAQDLMPRLDVDAAGVASVVEEPTLTPHQFPRGASPGTFLHSFV